MKKIILAIISMAFISNVTTTTVNAQNDKKNLSEYHLVLNKINENYNSDLSIYDKNSFIDSDIASYYNYDYNEYLYKIINTNLSTFEQQCIELATLEIDDINIDIKVPEKSTLASKTVKFNSSRNSMTLTYRHSGSKFDTSYKPSVKVQKLSSTYFFTMTSHSGSFKNSNKTYSVVAKGKIYTNFGVANGKTFTVNFNL